MLQSKTLLYNHICIDCEHVNLNWNKCWGIIQVSKIIKQNNQKKSHFFSFFLVNRARIEIYQMLQTNWMNNSQWDEARGGGWTKRTNRGEGKFFFHRTNRIVENWTMTLFSRKRSALLLYFFVVYSLCWCCRLQLLHRDFSLYASVWLIN